MLDTKLCGKQTQLGLCCMTVSKRDLFGKCAMFNKVKGLQIWKICFDDKLENFER